MRNKSDCIYLKASDSTVENCNVYDNTNNGIYLYNSPNSNVTNCNVYDGLGSYSKGIYLYNSGNTNIKNCIVYNQNNSGIDVYNSPNSNITNCNSHDNLGYDDYSGWTGFGIQLRNSVDSNIENCDSTNNYCGVQLDKSSNSVLTDNVINGNMQGFVVKGAVTSDFNYYIDTSNTIDGKPIWYLIGQVDITIDETSNFGYLALISCTNVTVKNVDLPGLLVVNTVDSTFLNIDSHHGAKGFTFYESSNNDIIDCDIYNNSGGSSDGYGIYLYKYSDDNKIDNCRIYNNTNYAIYMYTAESNEVMNCDLEGGVYIYYNSHYTTLLNCSMHNGKNGIYLDRSNYVTITDCEIYNNYDPYTSYGIYLYRSAYCTLTGNAFYDNKVNFYVKGYGGDITYYIHYIDSTNTVNGKAMYYILNDHDKLYDGSVLDFGYLAWISCDHMTAQNADVEGILVVNTVDSLISNITSHGTYNGIFLVSSYHNDIEDCTLYDNDYGMTIDDGSYYINIRNCVAYNNSKSGIYNREYSDHNTFENCITYNNGYSGFDIYNAESVSIINCTTYNNNQYGVKTRLGIKHLFLENIVSYDNTKDGFKIEGAGMGPSGENYIKDCTAYGNSGYGFYLRFCSATNLTGNAFYDNAFNFNIDGTQMLHYQHSIDPSNTVDGKPIYYLTEQSDLTLDETNNIGYLGLISCTNMTVKNSDVQGVTIADTTDSTLLNVTSHHSYYGFSLMDSSYNEFIDCAARDNNKHGMQSKYSPYNNWINCVSDRNKGGMHFYHADHCNIINCTNSNSGGASEDGIWFQYSWDCNIINCESYNNKDGIYFWSSSDRGNIINNSVHHNSRYGIYMSSSSNNKMIYHNIFANNGQYNVRDRCSNQWDNGYPSGGNYYSDYTGIDIFSGPGQNISGSDGIGDTPYIVPDGLNQDNYPLMSPPDGTSPIITDVMATPALQKYPTEPVNITCMVIDNVVVDTVKVHVDGPEGFTLEEEMNEGSYWYEAVYSILGEYDYFIWANDTSGNIATSDTYSFRVTDIVLPISSVDPLPLWTNTVPFTVTATADAPIAVVDVALYYRYSEDETDWTNWTLYGVDDEEPWSWEFSGSDGYYEFYSIARDETDVEVPPTTADASTGIDTVPPVSTIILDGTMGDNGWYISIVTATLSATDDLSGVDATWYRIDTGYWQLYSTPFTISDDSVHTVEYYSFDNALNREDTNSIDVKIDKIAPITTHEFEGIPGADGWASNVTVTLSATDATSGVDHTKYKLDDGEWITYTEPFDVTEDGEYTLSYYSVDLAGNTETTKEVDFKIDHDTEPPVTTHEFEGTMGDNDWYTSNVVVTLTGEDDSSGVDYTMYKLEDDTEWQEYTGPILVTEDGEHTIMYYSVDKVGNEEDEKGPFDFNIDQTPPTIELTWDEENSKLVADVDDETSGVAMVEFYVNGEYVGEVTEAPYEWEVTNPRQGDTGQAIVYDNAGNDEISEEIDAVSQSQSQNISSSPVSFQILSWLFGLL